MRNDAHKPEKEYEIWTEVAGVSYEGRRSVIQRYCEDGSPLHIAHEPENPHDRNAMKVGVLRKGFFRTRAIQIGYLPRDVSPEVIQHLERGWTFKAWVYRVRVTENDWLYVKINVLLTPPAPDVPRVDAKPTPPPALPEPAKALPRFRPRIQIALPETWLQRAALAATALLIHGATLISLGLAVGVAFRRHSDILDLGVLSAVIGAGIWGLLLVARVK